MANLFGTDHHLEKLRSIAHSLLDECLARLDEPLGDSLCRLTQTGLPASMSSLRWGDGGDELFAGYDPFRAWIERDFTNRFPGRFTMGFAHYSSGCRFRT